MAENSERQETGLTNLDFSGLGTFKLPLNTTIGGVPVSGGVASVGANFPLTNVGTAANPIIAMPYPLPISVGGTGTSTPGLTAGAGIAISGGWPSQTITATGSAGKPLNYFNVGDYGATHAESALSGNVVVPAIGATVSVPLTVANNFLNGQQVNVADHANSFSGTIISGGGSTTLSVRCDNLWTSTLVGATITTVFSVCVADCAAAINAAFAAATSAASSVGGVVYFPAENYATSSSLIVPSNVSIRTENARMLPIGTVTDCFVFSNAFSGYGDDEYTPGTVHYLPSVYFFYAVLKRAAFAGASTVTVPALFASVVIALNTGGGLGPYYANFANGNIVDISDTTFSFRGTITAGGGTSSLTVRCDSFGASTANGTIISNAGLIYARPGGGGSAVKILDNVSYLEIHIRTMRVCADGIRFASTASSVGAFGNVVYFGTIDSCDRGIVYDYSGGLNPNSGMQGMGCYGSFILACTVAVYFLGSLITNTGTAITTVAAGSTFVAPASTLWSSYYTVGQPQVVAYDTASITGWFKGTIVAGIGTTTPTIRIDRVGAAGVVMGATTTVVLPYFPNYNVNFIDVQTLNGNVGSLTSGVICDGGFFPAYYFRHVSSFGAFGTGKFVSSVNGGLLDQSSFEVMGYAAYMNYDSFTAMRTPLTNYAGWANHFFMDGNRFKTFPPANQTGANGATIAALTTDSRPSFNGGNVVGANTFLVVLPAQTYAANTRYQFYVYSPYCFGVNRVEVAGANYLGSVYYGSYGVLTGGQGFSGQNTILINFTTLGTSISPGVGEFTIYVTVGE